MRSLTYRDPSPPPVAIVAFGTERRRALMVALALGLIAVSVATIVAWYVTGGRVNGSILLPAAGGIALLVRRRGGVIEFRPGDEQITITLRTLLTRRVRRIPVRDLAGLTVAPAGTYTELKLRLRDDQSFALLDAPNEQRLERDRVAVSAFLLENKLI